MIILITDLIFNVFHVISKTPFSVPTSCLVPNPCIRYKSRVQTIHQPHSLALQALLLHSRYTFQFVTPHEPLPGTPHNNLLLSVAT
ncbi:hypothetical protein L596_020147 [Steinernema carpocapsae]|uniref:Uncharacterized protein n=1 Tax=Steinernema carpocapsae TaxID=34508 RepID=A0A4U5MSP4_STECR|nr:hypothetical protein L596_020147 [Steinernema carpocapsae]